MNALKRYWLWGAGALKIKWGAPGDWSRCRRQLRKHVGDERAKRICQDWHRERVGFYTGDRRNQ